MPDNGARDKRLAADVRQQATDVAAKWSAVQTRGAELVLPQRAAQQHQETAQQAGAITAAVAAAVAPTPPAAEYAMSGTATYAGLRYAWLNGHLYAEGDSTATGTRLAQVGKDYVVLVDKQGARHVVQSAKK